MPYAADATQLRFAAGATSTLDKVNDVEQQEVWRDVVGFEDLYEVSNMGRVRRHHLFGLNRVGTYPGKILKPQVRGGYLRAGLRKPGYKAPQWRFVHVLVAEAFIGPCPPRHTVNHKNGDKKDNRLENLETVPHSDNLRHAEMAGLRHSNVGGTFLNQDQVLEVVAAVRSGESQRDVAKRFGVHRTAVNHIMTGRRWARVTGIDSTD